MNQPPNLKPLREACFRETFEYLSQFGTNALLGRDAAQLLKDAPEIPECTLLNEEYFKQNPEAALKAAKAPRERSRYQQFISDCMKEGGQVTFNNASEKMKACALKWQQKKTETKNQPK